MPSTMSTSSAPELTLRHAQYFAGAHASLATSAAKGRHLVATRDLAYGDTILVSEAYLTALFPSFKKRICATCLRDGGRRLAVQCGACGQAWYCSEACRAAHSSGGEASGVTGVPGSEHHVPRIPHSLLCPVLKQFGGLKADADMHCIIVMCLGLLALQRMANEAGSGLSGEAAVAATGMAAETAAAGKEAEPAALSQRGGPAQPPEPATAGGSSPPPTAARPEDAEGTQPEPQPGATQHPSTQQPAAAQCQIAGFDGFAAPALRPGHADFELLQFHPVLSERDAQQWRRATAFLQTALRRAGWPDIPSQEVLLSWVGRIAANSFGLHIDSPAAMAGGTAGGAAGDASGGQRRTAAEGGGAAGLSDGPNSATVDAVARLHRLQLAQRRLWEDDAATAEFDTTPAELDAAAAAAKRQQRNYTAELGVAAAREPESGGPATPADGAAAAPAASEAAAGAEGAAAAAPGGLPPDVDSAGGGGPMAAATPAKDGPAAAHSSGPLPCAAKAGDGLGVADHAGRCCSEPVGRELFISASYFNHSCQPNCIIRRRAAFGVVTAQADIKAGAELCISYIDLEVPRSARQATLQKFFHFICDCSRCREEALAGSGKISYESASMKSGKDNAPKRRGRKARISR